MAHLTPRTARLLPIALGVFLAFPLTAIPAGRLQNPLSASEAQALLQKVLETELNQAQNTAHPMRYILHKSSPRLTTTKVIFETRDGDVALLTDVNGNPLDDAGRASEEARLNSLIANPGAQKHRKQSEDQDTARALKVLRALPAAFLYEPMGLSEVQSPKGTETRTVEKYSFTPNPSYSPPDLETQVLTQMQGEIWIDPVAGRAVHLEGHLRQDVDFGWGILGRLNKGGWIAIDQAEVANGVWRTVHFKMVMSGRVVFKNKVFDTVEDQSQFTPVPAGIPYTEAIRRLLGANETASR